MCPAPAMGATMEIQDILNYKVTKGNFFNDQDEHRDAGVCLLGA